MIEVDIWRAANLVIEQHREGAQAYAQRRSEELLASGDQAGHDAWKRILEAIDTLLRTTPDGKIH